MRGLVLSFLAGLASASGQMQKAEGYMLELLSWCAFSEEPVTARS